MSGLTQETGKAIETSNRRVLAKQINKLLRIRERADEQAAFLIDILDGSEADPDLEDNGDEEPTLGWPGNGPHVVKQLSHKVIVEDGELEHSLGWSITGQCGEGDYYGGDLEKDDADMEDNGDLEPNLAGSHTDLESDGLDYSEGTS